MATATPFSSLNTIVDASVARLNELLIRRLRAAGTDFADRARSASGRLPEDLARSLSGLAEAQALLKAETAPEPERLADFAFRCGQLYEQIEAFQRVEMEMENVRLGPDSVEPVPLQSSQVERLTRFVEVRDRLFRKVADFTLKALLIGLGLLMLGLVLGLV